MFAKTNAKADLSETGPGRQINCLNHVYGKPIPKHTYPKQVLEISCSNHLSQKPTTKAYLSEPGLGDRSIVTKTNCYLNQCY